MHHHDALLDIDTEAVGEELYDVRGQDAHGGSQEVAVISSGSFRDLSIFDCNATLYL